MSSTSETSVVEITYSNPGARPPVYVAASFTHPAWQPQELGYRVRENASNDSSYEYEFFKSFHVSVGTWQYKFRLGTGDWWACDERHEIVMDATGNYNNLLIVEASSEEDLERFRNRSQISDACRDSFRVPDTQEPNSQSDPDISKATTDSCHSPERTPHGEYDLTATGTKDEQRLSRGNYHFSEGVQRRTAAPIKPSASSCEDDDEPQPLATPNIWQKFWRWLRSMMARIFGL